MFLDPFSFVYSVFPLLVMALFLFAVIRGLREWSRNNASPRLSVPATVAGTALALAGCRHDCRRGSRDFAFSRYPLSGV